VFSVSPEQWDALVDLAGGWPAPAPEVAAVEEFVEGPRSRAGSGQGYLASAEQRRAIEDHAMALATQYYARLGWEVTDVSLHEPYDLRCTRAGVPPLHVEVKGTTGDGSQVLLTPNEVAHARTQHPHIALVVVANLSLMPTPDGWVASGCDLRVVQPWLVDDTNLRPIGFVLSLAARPNSNAQDRV
jgi:hypothetical protein